MASLSLKHVAIRGLAAMALSVAAGPSAWAEAPYPSRPITIVIGSGAGSGADVLCRVLAQGLQDAFKQPVIVENKVGAGGSLAAQSVARAKPDGYTLLFGSASGTVIAQATQPRPTFDVSTDLAAAVQVGAGGVPLVVNPRFPASNMREFIAVVKANPGKYQYGTFGIGTSGHLIMESIKNRTGIKLDMVPYKSVPAILQDMQGGIIDIAFVDTGSVMPMAKAGKLKVLGISGSRRAPGMPDVPLLSEQSIQFDTDGWYGVFGPKGTSPAVLKLLNQEVLRLLTAPEMRERLLQLNVAEAPVKSPEQFAKTVRDDLAVWKQIVTTNHISVE